MSYFISFLLGSIFSLILFWTIEFLSISIYEKKHPEESEEVLDAQFYKAVRDNQDFYWNDGFDRGYEKAMAEFYLCHNKFLTDEEKILIDKRLNKSIMSKEEWLEFLKGEENEQSENMQ